MAKCALYVSGILDVYELSTKKSDTNEENHADRPGILMEMGEDEIDLLVSKINPTAKSSPLTRYEYRVLTHPTHGFRCLAEVYYNKKNEPVIARIDFIDFRNILENLKRVAIALQAPPIPLDSQFQLNTPEVGKLLEALARADAKELPGLQPIPEVKSL